MGGGAKGHLWRSEDNFVESFLSCYLYLGYRDQTLVSGLSNPYLLIQFPGLIKLHMITDIIFETVSHYAAPAGLKFTL
jgi:hypothetical protein